MSEIVWEDPPLRESYRPPGKWPQRLAPLVEHPGRWARVYEAPSAKTAYSTTANLKSGAYKIPPGRWEFKTRGARVYAQYLGS
jgi:hypothetical protein